MDLLQAISNGHCGADCDHGVTFGIRRGQACDQVGAARPGSDQYHSRSPGHATYAGGDERGVLFMPADYRLDFGIQECVEDLFDFSSGYAENVLDSLSLQTLY